MLKKINHQHWSGFMIYFKLKKILCDRKKLSFTSDVIGKKKEPGL
jgi:hypothetical protein